MSEIDIREELLKKQKNIDTFEKLTAYLKDIEENYNCGYGEAPIAMGQAAAAVAWYFSKQFGITGFQAGFVMWEFLRNWTYRNNQTALRVVNYDDMLYPQYDYKFEKTITPETWESIQEAAKKNLETDHGYSVHPKVREHWESIVAGNIPFGYTIRED